MTYDLISFENLLIGGLIATISAIVVAALSRVSQMKQPKLRPIPIRVRQDDVRTRRSIRRDF